MICARWEWRRATAGLVITAVGLLVAHAKEAQRSHFDLPADTIERSIKRFAAQSGLEVLVPVDDLPPRVKTRAVRGRMTSREALEAMLVGTGLTVVTDPTTRALAVRRISAESPDAADSNGPRPDGQNA